jgi:hypothetical protein
MKIAFERSIRQSLRPYRYGSWGDNFKCTSLNGSKIKFNVDHIMLINIFHDLFITSFWQTMNDGIIPDDWRGKAVWDNPNIPNIINFTKYNSLASYDSYLSAPTSSKTNERKYSELIELYPFLDDRVQRASIFKKILQEINNTLFNLNMRVRVVYKEEKTYHNPKTHKNFTNKYPEIYSFQLNTMDKRPSHLMTFEIIEEESSGDRMSDLKFCLNPSGPLMGITSQGIRFVNIDWVPEEIYTTKINNYSKLIYILMLVGSNKKKARLYELKLMDIVERLQLNPNQKRNQLCSLVDRYLNELKENNFIKLDIRGNYKSRRYIIERKILYPLFE